MTLKTHRKAEQYSALRKKMQRTGRAYAIRTLPISRKNANLISVQASHINSGRIKSLDGCYAFHNKADGKITLYVKATPHMAQVPAVRKFTPKAATPAPKRGFFARLFSR